MFFINNWPFFFVSNREKKPYWRRGEKKSKPFVEDYYLTKTREHETKSQINVNKLRGCYQFFFSLALRFFHDNNQEKKVQTYCWEVLKGGKFDVRYRKYERLINPAGDVNLQEIRQSYEVFLLRESMRFYVRKFWNTSSIMIRQCVEWNEKIYQRLGNNLQNKKYSVGNLINFAIKKYVRLKLNT